MHLQEMAKVPSAVAFSFFFFFSGCASVSTAQQRNLLSLCPASVSLPSRVR